MPEIAFVFLLIPVAMCLMDWRKGLVLCVLTALVQDPLRKLTPGQPVYFVVFVGAVFAATWVAALRSRVRLGPNAIQGWHQYVGTPFVLFLLLVLAQAVHSFIRLDQPMVAGIGLLSYLTPIPAVAIAYQIAMRRGLAGIRSWMWLYVLAASVALSSVYLEFVGFDWPVLGEVGEGLLITGYSSALKAYAGTFRSSEVAAWHVATTACLMFMLLMGRRFTVSRTVATVAFVAFLLSVGLLTGRRKMLVEVAVFFATYVFFVTWFKKGAGKLAILAAATGIIAFLLIVSLVSPDPGEGHSAPDRRADMTDTFERYADRGTSVLEDIPERISGFGVYPIMSAIDAVGWFGAGLGTGSQGVQYYTGAMNIGAAEGGLGKITLELGVPGLALLAWLLIAFGRYVHVLLVRTTKASEIHARFAYGFVGFLVANAAAFSIATQVYGDVFILLLLGWTVGFLLAMPVLAIRETGRAPTANKVVQQRPVRTQVRHA